MIKITRRSALMLYASLAALTLTPPLAADEQKLPNTIRLLVGFAPGTSTDLLARLYAEQLRAQLGSNFIVENKPGAGGALAIQDLLTSENDGSTLLVATGSNLAQGPGVRTDLRYSPLGDFTMISMLGTNAGVIFVSKEMPVKTLAEFIDYARAHPGDIAYGSAGVGSASHLHAEYFQKVTGIELVHVPYKSDSEPAMAVAGNTLQMAFTNIRSMLPFYASQTVQPLATIDFKRSPLLPEVPSIGEPKIAGLDTMPPFSFFGLVGPATLPPEVAAQVNDAIQVIAARPEVIAQSADNLLIEPAAAENVDFRQFVETELTKWKNLGLTITP